MPERITLRQFEESDGVGDWKAVGDIASACFRTGAFTTGVDLVVEIGRLAEEMNHHPDIDLRYSTLTVRLSTHDVMGLSELDVELARKISAAARARDIDADVSTPPNA